MSRKKWSRLKKKSYLWVTLLLFIVSLTLHWWFGWSAYKNEEAEKGLKPQFKEYVVEATRDTMENWQSEFLQLIWQVAGLSFLFYVGSPQSREGDERKEEKLDYIIKKLAPDEAEKIIKDLGAKYPEK